MRVNLPHVVLMCIDSLSQVERQLYMNKNGCLYPLKTNAWVLFFFFNKITISSRV